MKDIFTELFYTFEDTSPISLRKADDAEEKLIERLDKKGRELFDSYCVPLRMN